MHRKSIAMLLGAALVGGFSGPWTRGMPDPRQPRPSIASMFGGGRRKVSGKKCRGSTSKYTPHQGKQEMARRVRQMERGIIHNHC